MIDAPEIPARAPEARWLLAVAVAAYLLGLAFRYYYIFVAHPAAAYVLSDMAAYHFLATNFFSPSYQPTILDTFYPPGTTYYFALLYRADPSWTLAYAVQCALSAAVPLLIAAIANQLYGRRAALLALIVASLYFPFIDHAAYFLSENPFLFSVTVWMWLLLRARRAASGRATIAWALASGVALGVAVSFKNAVLGPALLTYAALAAVGGRRGLAMVALSIVGASTLLVPMTMRATALSGGRFSFVANNLGANVLGGHLGRIKAIIYKPDAAGRAFYQSPPGLEMAGYQEVAQVPFDVLDTPAALAYSAQWVRAHPSEAFWLSMEHVWNLFGGVATWPTGRTEFAAWAQPFRFLFWPFILLPALLVPLRHARAGRRDLLAADLLLWAPVLGIAVAAFLTMGEPRYRTPFDSFLIVLASAFYATWWRGHSVRVRHAG